MLIDIHSHYIPPPMLRMIESEPRLETRIVTVNQQRFLEHAQGYYYPLPQVFYDLEARLAYMREKRLTAAVLSCAPPMFYYWEEGEVALAAARLINDDIAAQVAKYPQQFRGMATVPLQDPELAVSELKRCVEQLGFRAVQIGANIESVQLDDPSLLPFFQACEKWGVFVNIHPYYVGAKSNLGEYYLTNLIGNPLDTTVAISRMIFGGVLDCCPGLEVCLAHGGGFFPYQLGRLHQGYQVRQECHIHDVQPPQKHLANIYYDTLLFQPLALLFLCRLAGVDHILMGTDYPFDMQDADPENILDSLALTAQDRAKIAGGNAVRRFGFDVD